MVKASWLIQELKSHLKQRRITNCQLATELSLSESAIKQMLAGGTMSLQRLERICEILSMDISDLVAAMDARARQLQALPPSRSRNW